MTWTASTGSVRDRRVWKKTWPVSVIVGTVVLVSGCALHRSSRPEVEARVADRNRTFFAALAAKDLEATLSHFSDRAVIHTADSPPVVGLAEIRAFYAKAFGFLSAASGKSTTMRVSSDGEMAYDIGDATNTFTRGPTTVTFVGKYLIVWERVDSGWTIAAYSLSSNSPTR